MPPALVVRSIETIAIVHVIHIDAETSVWRQYQHLTLVLIVHVVRNGNHVMAAIDTTEERAFGGGNIIIRCIILDEDVVILFLQSPDLILVEIVP